MNAPDVNAKPVFQWDDPFLVEPVARPTRRLPRHHHPPALDLERQGQGRAVPALEQRGHRLVDRDAQVVELVDVETGPGGQAAGQEADEPEHASVGRDGEGDRSVDGIHDPTCLPPDGAG